MATVPNSLQVQRSKNAPANPNPYQTPSNTRMERKIAVQATVVPALHSDRTIGVATFLGGVVAGAILITRNNFMLGQKADAVLFLMASIVWQAILIGVALVLPFALPSGVSMGIVFGQAFVMQLIAKHSFAKQYATIAAGRGQWGHWGWAALSIAVPVVTIFSIVVGVSMLLQ